MTGTERTLPAEPKPEVRRVAEQMAEHLDAISRLFKPGVKLTLLVRNPRDPERSAFLTDEEGPDAACRAIRQLFKNPSGGSFDV
jgi:hypothetical protein